MSSEGRFGGRSFNKPVEEGKEYEVDIKETSRRGDGVARVEGFVIFVPETKPAMEMPQEFQQGRVPIAIALDAKSYERKSIFELSPVVSSLKGFLDVARVYTTAEYRSKVHDAAISVFGEAPPAYRVSF